ncbi:molybdopterin-dependent oxidoreductase [Roseibium sp.]|uniref:molybdopterin-dependent oxidoreductase n=1 Tax=Roseibium sp. TaxID=1936156 RepID=UPI003A9720C8
MSCSCSVDEVEIPKALSWFTRVPTATAVHRADVIPPGAAYTEKSATYVNTEGRVQM